MAITKKELMEYCVKRGISIPKSAGKYELCCAIVRHKLHGSKLTDSFCFGYWCSEDPNCLICFHDKICRQISLGETKV